MTPQNNSFLFFVKENNFGSIVSNFCPLLKNLNRLHLQLMSSSPLEVLKTCFAAFKEKYFSLLSINQLDSVDSQDFATKSQIRVAYIFLTLISRFKYH